MSESKCPICSRPMHADDLGLCAACWWEEKTWSQSE